MELLINALVSFVASIAANILTELTKERAPALAHRLIDSSARRLAAYARDRYREEWLADIHQLLEEKQVAGALAIAISVYLWHGRRVARTVGWRVSHLQALTAAVLAVHLRLILIINGVVVIAEAAGTWALRHRMSLTGLVGMLLVSIGMGALTAVLGPKFRRTYAIAAFAVWFQRYVVGGRLADDGWSPRRYVLAEFGDGERVTVRDVAKLYTLLAEEGVLSGADRLSDEE
jgi:hypothetical protein